MSIPIRAGRAETPEGSDFTSIQVRIRDWQKWNMKPDSAPSEAAAPDMKSAFVGRGASMPENEISDSIPNRVSARANAIDGTAYSIRWLCPIQSDSKQRGILQMTAAECFELVDKSGRMTR
jgi:hypothetical protein